MLRVPRQKLTKLTKSRAHKDIETLIGPERLEALVGLQKQIHKLEDRIYNQEHSDEIFALEEEEEPNAFKRRLAPDTVSVLKSRLDGLKTQMLQRKAAVGVSSQYHELLEDVLKNALVEEDPQAGF